LARSGVAALAALAFAAFAEPAGAVIPPSLHSPANCADHTAGPLDYWFCDDLVPANSDPQPGPGGVIPNQGGARAITVPAKYGGDGFTGLPVKAADANSMLGADADGNVALDVDAAPR
jgi:hypothetical protein